MGISVLDIVEATYAGVDGASAHTWLTQLLEHVHELCGTECGGFAYAYDLNGPPETWQTSTPIVCGMPEGTSARIAESFATLPGSDRAALFPRLGPSGTLSEATGFLFDGLPPEGRAVASELEVNDSIHVNAFDPDRRGVLVAINTRGPTRLGKSEKRRLAMLAAHVASARRLLIARGDDSPVAIFESSGKLAHHESAHEPALGTLRERMLELERIRKARSESESKVLERWQALVAGRYSLVSRFDKDGRRYVMAYENSPDVSDPRGLSQREIAAANLASFGHTQKLIAYELGVAPGTVASLLARANQKLGVQSAIARTELLRAPECATTQRLGDGRELVLFSSPLPQTPLEMLSQAEREVALAVAQGDSNASIAATRGVSVRTVEHQLASVFRKLGVASRLELTLHIQQGVPRDARR